LIKATTTTDALAFFSEMKELHSAWWNKREKPHAFRNPFFDKFHRLLISRTLMQGTVQMSRVQAGNQLLGYLYNFRHGDREYAYQSGFVDFPASARPGAVAHALAIQHAVREGLSIYDFMAGENRLKKSYSNIRIPMYWQVVQQPRFKFRLEAYLTSRHNVA
jgi:CelD/BcsL family acetyltransferase involved in cellulose biosynthesis